MPAEKVRGIKGIIVPKKRDISDGMDGKIKRAENCREAMRGRSDSLAFAACQDGTATAFVH